MIRNSLKSSTLSQPAPSFQKGIIIKRIMSFIEQQLIDFQDEYINNSRHSEERTSQFLVNFLVDTSKNETFIFSREPLQKQKKGHDKRADIGAFLHRADHSPIFVLEAKRLPTPGSGRTKEYVIGVEKNSGGIERFKLGMHGEGLDISAMVAYVEKKEHTYWIDEINSWVDALAYGPQESHIDWKPSDRLTNLSSLAPNKVSKASSKHSRLNNTNMTLTHFFINIKKK